MAYTNTRSTRLWGLTSRAQWHKRTSQKAKANHKASLRVMHPATQLSTLRTKSRYWNTDTNHQKPSVACKRSISFLEASWIERTWNRSCQHQDEKTPHSAWVIPPDAPETRGVWLIKCLGQTTSSTFLSRSGFLNDALCCIKCVTYSTNNIPHSFIHFLWVKHTTQCHSSLIICISHCFRSQYLSGPWQPGFCLPLGWWWGDTGPSAVFQHFDFHLTLPSSEK